MAEIKIPLTFQIYQGDQVVRTEKLTQSSIKIGKVPTCHLRLEDESVSKIHATIEVEGPEQIVITDLGAPKGTFVNGERVTSSKKVTLRSGDEILIGQVRMVLTVGQVQQAVAATAAAVPAATAPVSRPRRPRPAPIDFSQFENANVVTAEVRLVFGGANLQVLHLAPIRRLFVGDSDGCDFYVSKERLGQEKIPLIWTNGEVSSDSFSFCFLADAEGEITSDDGKTRMSLSQAVQTGRATALMSYSNVYSVSVTRDTFCRVAIGSGLELQVRAVAAPIAPAVASKMDVPIVAYTAGSTLACGLLLALIFAISPDARSLDLNQFETSNQLANATIKPDKEKEEKTPEILKSDQKNDPGGKGKKHAGDEGKMGKKDSKSPTGLYAIKGPPNNPDPHLAREKALEAAVNSSVIQYLQGGATSGSPFASVFGRDTAVGSDPEDVLGGLYGSKVGEAEGGYGLGLRGTGIGGGGTGEGTLGLGNENTVGKGGGGGNGAGYGRGAGTLGGRQASAPDPMQGSAEIRGALDKEIIRRVIRRNINQIKFCYEDALQREPSLSGRVKISFVIAPNGSVSSANPAGKGVSAEVDACVARKIAQLSFPAPEGGGIVEVTYPFTFQSAGTNAQ